MGIPVENTPLFQILHKQGGILMRGVFLTGIPLILEFELFLSHRKQKHV